MVDFSRYTPIGSALGMPDATPTSSCSSSRAAPAATGELPPAPGSSVASARASRAAAAAAVANSPFAKPAKLIGVAGAGAKALAKEPAPGKARANAGGNEKRQQEARWLATMMAAKAARTGDDGRGAMEDSASAPAAETPLPPLGTRGDHFEVHQKKCTARPPADAVDMPGKVKMVVLEYGDPKSAPARAGELASIEYCCWLQKQGRKVDRGDVQLQVMGNEVIPGVDNAIRGMRLLERRKLWIPSKMGYGKKGSKPKVPPNSDLIFEVQFARRGMGVDVKKGKGQRTKN